MTVWIIPSDIINIFRLFYPHVWEIIWVITSSKTYKLRNIPANGFRASRLFSFLRSNGCDEFRSAQKLQILHFESAAYANFPTPAAMKNEQGRESENLRFRPFDSAVECFLP